MATNDANRAYRTLAGRFRRIAALEEAAGLLQWDLATLMPPGGAEARGEQLAALALTTHEMVSDPAMADLFGAAEAAAGELGPWDAANLREMRRLWLHETALPPDLVEARSRVTLRCEMQWREARPKSDFAAVLPALREVQALVRDEAAARAGALGATPYDALLDLYQPGSSAAQIDALFAPLAAALPELLGRALERQAREAPPTVPQGPFPEAAQQALCRRLMAAVGFDFDHGRLDTSLHPFCGGVPDDLRITTRYDEADFASAVMAVLHETGHALYDRGLPADWRLQPVGRDRGMAVHESQSLLIEMQACRSPEFLGFLAPQLRSAFGGSGPAWETANLIRLQRRVRPDFIRVDADEVTYPAHVILRTRLERVLLAGDLDPADLPGAWNEGMRDLLGVVPPDDRRGCLQDIHWFKGIWGYFPAYTVGAVMAAQLFDAARRAVPEILQAIGRGDFAPLLGWLRSEVHGRGSSLPAEALVERATGKPLGPETFLAHLRTRYLGAA